MDAELWQRARSLFEEMLELSDEQRRARVEAQCGDDADLKKIVLDLLRADRADGTQAKILDRPISAPVSFVAGDRIGNYSIEGVIGHGGMGTVYAARQDLPARSVAIKVVRAGIDNEKTLARFRFEAEMLGRLVHPGIAQIFEAGTFDRGDGVAPLPFFAMEHVTGGRDLDDWMRDDAPSQSERVTMMIRLCEAVHAGHLLGVVHRDLKPSNVLVDGGCCPKVIDYGIASSTTGSAERLTLEGQFVGTLGYASPEQLSGQATDARVDVYGLGVLAFRLLTDGGMPHEVEGVSLADVVRNAVEQDAPGLGERRRGLANSDLEKVVAKALQKDPGERYSSAAALAQDLQNTLDDRPVAARAPSAVYQLVKLARRHRVAAAALMLMSVAVVVGAVAVGVQNARIRAEQARTQRASDFFRGIIAEADATRRGKDFTMRAALDAAAVRIDVDFAGDPDLRAEVHHVVGETYRRLSVFDSAERHLRLAFSLREAMFGEGHGLTLVSLGQLALTLWSLDRTAEALALQRPALARMEQLYGLRDERTLGAAHDLALFEKYVEEFDASESRLRAVLSARRELLGEDAVPTMSTEYVLGKLLLDTNRDAEAQPILRRVLAGRERILGSDHVDTLVTLDVLGLISRRAGRYAEAETAHRRALAGFVAKLGETHEHSLAATNHLAWTLMSDGRAAEAQPLIDAALSRCDQVLGPDHQHTARVRQLAGAAARENGDGERALELMRAGHASMVRVHGEAHAGAQTAAHNLAYLLHERGEFEEGLEVLRVAGAARADPASGAREADALDASRWMTEGLCLIGLSKFDRAESKLVASWELHSVAYGREHEASFASLNCLVRLYEAWRRPEPLARWTAERDAVAAARSSR